MDTFLLNPSLPLKAQNAGLFISRGGASHPNRVIQSHELIMVKQGVLDFWEETQHFHLEAGDTLHLYPKRRHGGLGLMPIGLKFYWIHFEMIEADNADFISSLKIPQVVHLPQPERLERLFLSFLDDQESGLLHPYAANLLTLQMLGEISHAVDIAAADKDAVHIVASWAHTFICMNADRALTTSKIAAALGYNADYVGRVYRQTYGLTLTEAIHRRRVDIACNYLLDSNLNIEQIASKCGYSDPDYFRRVFKRYSHVTPSDYREQHANVHINTH